MRTLLVIIYFIFPALIFSQSSWDLEQCIKYATDHNIAIKQSELNAQINKNNTDQSKAGMLPTLNVGAQHNYNFGKTVDRFSGTFANTQFVNQNFFLSSNLTLWSGLSQYNTIKANEFTYMSSIENTKQQEIRNQVSK